MVSNTKWCFVCAFVTEIQTWRIGPVFWENAVCVLAYLFFDFTDVNIYSLATALNFSHGFLKIYFDKPLLASHIQSIALRLEALGIWQGLDLVLLCREMVPGCMEEMSQGWGEGKRGCGTAALSLCNPKGNCSWNSVEGLLQDWRGLDYVALYKSMTNMPANTCYLGRNVCSSGVLITYLSWFFIAHGDKCRVITNGVGWCSNVIHKVFWNAEEH